MIVHFKHIISQILPDATPVIPADEGGEGTSLTSVAVGAHQPISTGTIPAILAATHLSRTLHTDHIATGVPGLAIVTVLGLTARGTYQVLGAGRRKRITCNILVIFLLSFLI